MNRWVLLGIGLALTATGLSSQNRRVIVVEPFTLATDVELPYDMKQLQVGLVADLKVQIGKEFEIVAEAPATPQGSVYRLTGEFTGWRPGNAAKRILVGMGSGREASDIHYLAADTLVRMCLTKPTRSARISTLRAPVLWERSYILLLRRSPSGLRKPN